jgi:signal peptidase I
MRRRRLFYFLLVAATLVLAGCGHDGDGPVVPGLPRYVVQQSGSMEPTLQIGQRLRTRPVPERIERGGIFVIRFADGGNRLIKRVVGLPGERIAADGGRVTIDGKPIEEPYLPEGIRTGGLEQASLGPDEYFVLGDNRPDSQDSRTEGPVTRDRIEALIDP